MDKKQKYIIAAIETAEKYRAIINAINNEDFDCVDKFIYVDCPLASSSHSTNRAGFNSFVSLEYAIQNYTESKTDYAARRHLKDMLERRVQFHLDVAIELVGDINRMKEEALWSIEEEKRIAALEMMDEIDFPCGDTNHFGITIYSNRGL